MLSSEREVAAAIEAEALADYIAKLYEAIGQVAPSALQSSSLTVHIELAPETPPVVELALTPALAIRDALHDGLRSVAAPHVRGPVAFELTIKLGSDA